MQIITLYKYKRADGGITVSPINPHPKKFDSMYRIVADEGKVLTNGITKTTCADIEIDDFFNWREIDAPMEETEQTQNI
jgi:hypothetical protein